MKNKIYNIIIIILIFLLIAVILMIVIKYGKNHIKEKNLETVVDNVRTKIEQVEKQKETNNKPKEIETEYKGYKVVGIIKIPKINIEYPILDKTNDASMKVSITKFWGNSVNDIGNFSMAGHSYFDGTMFSKINKLNKGDKIEMTDLKGIKIEYEVFDKYLIDPRDVSCVNSVKNDTREITLITCKNGRKNRLIIKAREIL